MWTFLFAALCAVFIGLTIFRTDQVKSLTLKLEEEGKKTLQLDRTLEDLEKELVNTRNSLSNAEVNHKNTEEDIRKELVNTRGLLRNAEVNHRNELSREKMAHEATKRELQILKGRSGLLETIDKQIAEQQKELDRVTAEVISASVDVSNYDNLTSEECKNELQILKIKEKELTQSNKCFAGSGSADKRELANDKKQILRCFNAECSVIIDSVSVKNVDVSRGKIRKAYETVNKIFETDAIALSQDYLALKLEELSLVYAYMLKLEQEKETRKEIRAQMVEEEKVRREIEKEKARLEKEEAQFKSEVTKLMEYMAKAKDEIQSQLYADKIRELEEKIKALESDKNNVLEREMNTRAGFVYIISNIGSFGEQVFKIGMTRRLEPLDRVKELGDASVPFPFDVHAMIFSADAPDLETILHQHFRQYQVNKVNPRKEFYKVDLDDVKKVVLENHNATVEFITIADAYDYRETLRLEAESESLSA